MRKQIFSTDGCTLCDKVIDKLLDLSVAQGSELIVTDVSLDDELLNRYGADIPVIKISGKILRSPFSDEELLALIEQSTA